MPEKLELCLLGNIDIRRNGTPLLDLQAGKALALLSYLAVTGRPHTRPVLAGLLWGGMPEVRARANLSKALSTLRRVVGEHVHITRQAASFDRDSEYWLDVAAFEAAVSDDTVERLQAAVQLYAGDFMDGFYVLNAPEFETWVLGERTQLREMVLKALHTLATHFVGKGQGGQATAMDYTAHLLRLEPWREKAHRQMMRLLALSGQRGAALAQYETCRQVLAKELGVEPEPETVALYEQIRQGEFTSAPVTKAAPLPSTISLPDIPLPDLPATPSNDEQFPFVAREQELAQLSRWLEQARAGQGRVAFVVGEPGSGKTALVAAFVRRALSTETGLVVAGGNCTAYGGIGDPYLPFREILNQLTGDVEARWRAGAISRAHARRLWHLVPQSVQALVNVGPDLFDVFIPASSVAERAARVAPHGAPWLAQFRALLAKKEATKVQVNLEQSDLFEAFTKVLQTLARQQPLILVLDDLQWADAGSISLLFHLGRRLVGQRILVVGIYRPNDVALGRDGERHPLEPVVNEFQRLFGDVPLDVGQAEGRHFIDSILDVERNRLNFAFREKLYQHTRGHALFTVEILRSLQAQGDLVQDEERGWVEGPAINWAQLPTRVEGVIGERIGRLPATLREMIKVASVMGEGFIAEVVARVLGLDEGEVIRQLGGALQQQHDLVQSQGARRLAGRRLSRYCFRHILFQYYAYQNIDETERAYLHEDVGCELEQLYQGQMGVVAVQLARHFREAGLVTRALDYLQQAGEQAALRWANQEAAQLFSDALALLKTLPEAPEKHQQELHLYMALADARWKAGQIAAALDTFQQSATLARTLGETEELARAALGFEHVRYRFNLPAEPAVRLLEEARNALGEENSVLRVRVLANLARALFSTGSAQELETLSEQAIEMARRVGDPAALYDTLQTSVLTYRRPEQIKTRIAAIDEMLRLAQEMGDQERTLGTFPTRVQEYLEFGDIQTVDATLEAGYLTAEEFQGAFWQHVIRVQQAMRAILAGDFSAGQKLAQQALEIGQQMHVENVDGTFGIQMFTIQREQGGLRGLAPVVKGFVKRSPAANTWRPGLALIYSDLGYEPEARAEFEILAADDFAAIPRDALWVGSMAYLSEVCAFLGDTARADILYRLLLPYARLNVVIGFAVVCLGAASRYLGLLAATMSRWTEAGGQFEAALEMNARLGAKPWLTHTQYQYAAMLLTRAQPGDSDRATALLDQALATAQQLGLKPLAEKAEALHRRTNNQMTNPWEDQKCQSF